MSLDDITLSIRGKNKKTWLFYFFAILLTYIMFFNVINTSDNFSVGSLERQIHPFSVDAFSVFASRGRFFEYFFMCINGILLHLFNISHLNNCIFQFIAICIYSFSAYVIDDVMVNNKLCSEFSLSCDGIISRIPILIMFINPLIIEWFTFSGYEEAFFIFFSILTARAILEGQNIKAVILGFLTVSGYQSMILVTIIIVITVEFLNNYNTFGKIIRKWINCFFICCVSVVLNLALQKGIVELLSIEMVERSIQLPTDIFEYVKTLLVHLWWVVIIMYGLYPPFLFIAIWVLVFFSVLVVLIKRKNMKGIMSWGMLNLLLGYLPFSYGLVNGNISYPPRTMITLFFSLGMIGIVLLFFVNQKISRIVRLGLIIIMIVNYFYVQTAITDCYITQALDKYELLSIENEIEKYEDETGITIDEIAFGLSSEAEMYYPQLNLLSHIYYTYGNKRMYWDWSRGNFYNIIMNTEYKYRNIEEDEINQYFDDDGRMYVFDSSRQLCFDGNTLYVLIF